MRTSKSILVAAATLSLGACSTIDRINTVGQAPALTPIIDPRDRNGDRAITMPMPGQEQVFHQPNSLWAAGARSFFKDQRATKIGDIVTVLIDISDKAEVSNKTSRSRKSGETAETVASSLRFLDRLDPLAVELGYGLRIYQVVAPI